MRLRFRILGGRRFWFPGLREPYDNRDAPVRKVERIFGIAQVLVGKSPKLTHLPGSQPVLCHKTSRGVRAVGRKIPVAIEAGGRVRPRIGVPFKNHPVLQLADLHRQRRNNRLGRGRHLLGTRLEEAVPLLVHQFNAQPVSRHGHVHSQGHPVQASAMSVSLSFSLGPACLSFQGEAPPAHPSRRYSRAVLVLKAPWDQ